jgi:hypothetical protein
LFVCCLNYDFCFVVRIGDTPKSMLLLLRVLGRVIIFSQCVLFLFNCSRSVSPSMNQILNNAPMLFLLSSSTEIASRLSLALLLHQAPSMALAIGSLIVCVQHHQIKSDAHIPPIASAITSTHPPTHPPLLAVSPRFFCQLLCLFLLYCSSHSLTLM